ncbi:S1 RNA-binding domain-containing protein [Bacillus cereus group sp. BfR-BA-01380]|uniref:S1 RNA-binding domain-containing protein n=1 Tax=Bacillus cereus group sp. BfR-BA-01380 TaxID=2920324 RepID=UPI001F562A78|nr:S1 RNA-binding domain-containing protein [Bacillus cereus group sp. BfR-BA-01380]
MVQKRLATVDTNIELHLHTTAIEHRDLKVIYKINSFVSVIVKNIVGFGIFVVTDDEYKIEGLLHINKFQDKFIKNIEEYISIGDRIDNVKVVGVNQENKLEFSSMHLTFEKMKNYTDKNTNDSAVQELSKEVMEIKKVLMNKVGIISKEAENRILKNIEENGLITFSMAMGRVLENYQVDLGMLLIEEIENKMSDYL